ncbi:MAG: transcriptional regulator [Candidatus Latescibacteria bacterium]|nr:ArsR family transcriptional regulator [Gemmatimonadaceae bacterium]MDP6016358.1 transcriptional regulator [Candidatus Latescibacterota bacterium]MDP7447860.1 transcriptional regulator [Candidatus Latescibacterota bacterium]HJP29657.1 transcriptional regulator [Candidatus Latescibacterota bacterium]
MSDPTVPDIDTLLHEPVRLRLLTFLSMLERADFMYLLRQSGVSKGNLSVQMAKLEEAGIVSVDKELVDGRPRTTYSLSAKGRKALSQYKRTMQEVLSKLPD